MKNDESTTRSSASTSSSTRTRNYTLKTGTHGRLENGVNKRYTKGETISLTDDEARALGSRVQPSGMPGQYEPTVSTTQVSGTTGVERDEQSGITGPPEGKGTAGDDPNASNWSALLDGMGWQEAVELINTLETEEEIEAVKEAERQGKNRKSVLEAADARLQ